MRDAAARRSPAPWRRGELRIDGVTLWRPGEGYLYDLDVEVLGPDGEVVDVYSQPIGMRTVAVDGHRFLINGEPFYFKGFGKHEDFAVHGSGHDDAVMVHDFELSSGSAPTRFARPTTPTTRPCSSTPTGTESSSSTRRRPWG